MTQKNIFLKFASDENDFTIGIHSDNSNVMYHTFPKIDLFKKYQTWSDIYDKYIKKKGLSLLKSSANREKNKEENQTIEELHNQCSSSYEELINELNVTLNNTERLKQDIESHVNKEKTSVRIICQFEAKELDIACIPWDHWDGLNDLYKENHLIVATSTQASPTTSKYQSSLDSVSDNRELNEASNKEGSKEIEILMILGEDKDNINVCIDSETFESFTKDLKKRANVSVNVELVKVNSVKNLKEVLFKKEWSIIYYCGHSSAIDDENDVELELGKDILGKKVKVKISELKDTFQKLTSQGIVKIVIFNSCESIATAFQLLPLGLPYVIAMKESIADFHAHYYIRYLLESLAIGLPFICAVEHCQPHLRDAYNTLMDIPGASIIPAFCLTSAAVSKLDDPIINLNSIPVNEILKLRQTLTKKGLQAFCGMLGSKYYPTSQQFLFFNKRFGFVFSV